MPKSRKPRPHVRSSEPARLARFRLRSEIFYLPGARRPFLAPNDTADTDRLVKAWQQVVADSESVDSLLAAVADARRHGSAVDGFQIEYVELEAPARPVNLQAALYAVLMGFLESYEPYELTFAADKVRIVISLSSLPDGWDTLRVERLHTEGGKSSLAEALEAELAKAQAPVVKKIRIWLKSLTNTTFERKEDAQEMVHTLTHLVRRAGHQLMYQGQPVTLAVIMTTRQRRPSIEVRGRVDGRTKPLRCSTELPEFTIRPLP